MELKRKRLEKIYKVVALIMLMISAFFFILKINDNVFNNKKDILMDFEIARVNDEIIEYDEYLKYLYKGAQYYEEEAGKDIWNVNSNNINMFEILKKKILDEMIQLKLQVSICKELGLYTPVMDDTDSINILKEYVLKDYVFNQEDFSKYINDNDINININVKELDEKKIKYEEEIRERIYKEYIDKFNNRNSNYIIINTEIYNRIKRDIFNE